MPLTTDAAIRNVKPTNAPTKYPVGKGLYLLVTPKGQKWWRLRYRFEGKEKMLGLGVYPEVSLKKATEKRDEARGHLVEGRDPSQVKREEAAERKRQDANSFEVMAREWYASRAPGWAPGHADKIIRRLELDVFPWIGSRPIAEIKAPELLAVARRIEARGALDTAHRAIQSCGQIFRYAVATGRAERDPSGDLRGALPRAKGGHFPSVTDPARVAELLRMIDGYQGTPTVRGALRLAPLVFVRPGELRQAEWADIDLEAAEWRYTATKTGTPHIVPLATQAVAILRELEPITGRGRYVFPCARGAVAR
ncbi:tyrosine-type recombinase/integrase [Thiocystis violacea]|uniref:tyrosine-type recombinase/integrase n=1 Tax=Thiocystis violacea TaxID=13725 RepID=UPI001F5B250A|nr:integrase arm-type DNA-binding domain-containing protein [Thiocystis violacea]